MNNGISAFCPTCNEEWDFASEAEADRTVRRWDEARATLDLDALALAIAKVRRDGRQHNAEAKRIAAEYRKSVA